MDEAFYFLSLLTEKTILFVYFPHLIYLVAIAEYISSVPHLPQSPTRGIQLSSSTKGHTSATEGICSGLKRERPNGLWPQSSSKDIVLHDKIFIGRAMPTYLAGPG